MKRYGYLDISPYGGSAHGLWISSSDADTLMQLWAEVLRLAPKARIIQSSDLAGRLCNINFSSLAGKDTEAFWHIRSWVCQNGWEPYAFSSAGSSFYYHFRKELDGE